MSQNLNSKVKTATKWSSITEVVVRLIAPLTSMVLARLLTPEAFGIVATINMVITFAEIFTDAGFQKYIIQHEFEDDDALNKSTTVAFWSNLVLSVLIWILIAVFNAPIARWVGNLGYGLVLAVACVGIPIAAFSSIQMARYKRALNFKILFKVRLIGSLMPLLVTVPLAFWLRSYWALIVGSISSHLIVAVLLTYYSEWKPTLYYSWRRFKEMFSFSIWSMVEAISIWLTANMDVFIVGTILGQYYLGIYKTSMTTVNQIMLLITSATTPILFSSLSRLQNDEQQFRKMFFSFQKLVAVLVFPMGVGIFCFRGFITQLLLGNQWGEAAGFIGLWALSSSVLIVLSHYCSEVYRAKGRPKLSVMAQWLHIVVLWPAVLIAAKYDFQTLYTVRAIVRFELMVVNLIIIHFIIKISAFEMIKNVIPAAICSAIMGIVAYGLLMVGDSIIWQCLSIAVCAICYTGFLFLFPKEKQTLLSFIKRK